MREYLLEMEGIEKSFPGVRALDKVELKVRPAVVHGVMGENGAGKSTLMKIIIGLYRRDGGTMRFLGESVNFESLHDSLDMGISMIHQELSPLPYMTVAQNIFLGREIKNKWGLIDHKGINRETARILEELKINLDPQAVMQTLSVAQWQLVEIAKAVSYQAKLVIMDEPTSALTEKEVQHLFDIIRDLKRRGVTIIYITHKMDEVFAITDEISVYRDGRFIGRKNSKELNGDHLITMMVGRSLDQFFHKEPVEKGEVVLKVENLSAPHAFNPLSFELRQGEILGFAGLVGAGRTELMESLFGLRPVSSGKIQIFGKEVSVRSPGQAIKNNMAFLTEDRKRTGVYANLSVRENISMANFPRMLRRGLIDHKAVEELCSRQVSQLSIKTPGMDQLLYNLSGGNQQKVLVSRWLATSPRILILDEPTRGIDVGAKSEIYSLMNNLVKEGKSILLVSSEMPEILALADRMAVMHEGSLIGVISREDASQEKILRMATGET